MQCSATLIWHVERAMFNCLLSLWRDMCTDCAKHKDANTTKHGLPSTTRAVPSQNFCTLTNSQEAKDLMGPAKQQMPSLGSSRTRHDKSSLSAYDTVKVNSAPRTQQTATAVFQGQ